MTSAVKAIALCRVSTQRQLEEGNLVPQEERIQAAANFLNADILKWWKVAVSSRRGKNVERKDIVEMYGFCKTHPSVKMLIIDEVDRFMRSIDEYYYWKTKFKSIKVELRFAKRPEINPDNTLAVFEELMDIFKAQQSNEERIIKTPANQRLRLLAGYYPSNPHTGYKKSEIPGLHIPDDPNWSAMRDSMKAIISGVIDIAEGLQQATARGLRTRNYGPRAIGGNKIDMYRWKELLVDPYYCGIIKFADWDLGDKEIEGLHQPMITREEHDILVQLVKRKGKRFTIRKGGNPDYPLAKLAECARCVLSEYKHPLLTSANQNNGAAKGYKVYKRYRCRACHLEVRREVFHEDLTEELSQLLLSYEQKEKLKEYSRKVWNSHEKMRIEKARIAIGKLTVLKDRKRKIVDRLIDAEAEGDDTAGDIKERLESLKTEIAEAEKVAAEAQDYEKDFDEFISFAFDFMDNLKGKWWELDKQMLGIYKQILFPSGIQLTPDKKVYIPEISPIYLYKTQKTAPKEAEISSMEGPLGREPRTPCLKGRCSNQLSYGPELLNSTILEVFLSTKDEDMWLFITLFLI